MMGISPEILNLILQLIRLAISEIPELINAEQTIVNLLESGRDPTPEERAQLDAAHDLIKQRVLDKLRADVDDPV